MVEVISFIRLIKEGDEMDHVKTIVLADDDTDLLKALMMRLSMAGYNVVTATDSYNALSLSVETRPAMLILDVNMPAGDGFSVQERLAVMAPELRGIPIIYITGDKSERLDEVAKNHGAIRVFHKPFKVDDLLDAIHGALAPQAA